MLNFQASALRQKRNSINSGNKKVKLPVLTDDTITFVENPKKS